MKQIQMRAKDANTAAAETTAKGQTEVAPTLIAHIERIVNLAIECHLDETFFDRADAYLSYVAERMNLTKAQTLVFALFMEKSTDYQIVISDFSDMIDCRTVRVIAMMAEADELAKRRFIRRIKNDDSIYYRVPFDVVTAVKENRVYSPEPIDHLTADKFFDRMKQIFDDDWEDTSSLLENLDDLLAANQQLEFSKALKCYDLLDDRDRLLFYIFCNRFVNMDNDRIEEHDWADYYTTVIVREIRTRLNERSHLLIMQNIIENENSDGMADSAFFRLTQVAKDKLFVELHLTSQQAKDKNWLSEYATFAAKELFYNPAVQSQIDQLSSLLMPEQFVSVQQRLEENGFRKGFACLFYGAPGTGKTETVYQIARRTKRDVMAIDVTRIKSCWVGRSERNIKAAFDRYRAYVKQAEHAPILLFNEADAVLGIRQEGTQRAVEKMENSIQNIILQEMESLDGIMIATTNLTQNLDKAFERRFLYKIEFEKPSLAAKRAIWQSMIPSLDDSLATTLAERYDFSGGQIENIARKRTVEMILHGAEPKAEQLDAYCRAEQLSNKATKMRRIGY